jgi:hypothetical protein
LQSIRIEKYDATSDAPIGRSTDFTDRVIRILVDDLDFSARKFCFERRKIARPSRCALNKNITMKRRFDLKRETRRSLPNGLELGKIKKRHRFAPLIGSAPGPGERINVDH